jgi:transglutaminase/protease-like cytokinesis protein 3
MKKTLLILFILSITFASAQIKNQYASIDKDVLKIPDSVCKSTTAIAGYITANFKTDNEKIRAIFFWTASKISYDIENMFAINFNETAENKITKTLQTKKGVCINYAEIFNALANKAGIKSVVIEGYTKQHGFTDYIPHAWSGARIDGKWYLFDPTWGSGYINNGKFVKKINEQYFKADPAKIIASHIPFDYLWQFLNYPVTNQEFYTGNIQINKSKTYFDYEKEITNYENLSELEKLSSTTERIEKNGVKNAMIFDRLAYKKREIEYIKQNKFTSNFNTAAAIYNEGVNLYNEYINYRNQQFKPVKPDDEIKKMIDEPKKKLLQAQELLNNSGDADANVTSVKKNIITTLKQVEEQEAFVKEYLSKGKAGRKSMFTKITFFGRPVN